jgi:hypothetical protein
MCRRSAAILGAFLETDTIITHLDLSNNKPLKEEAAVALAKGLTKNIGVLELNLMGLGGGNNTFSLATVSLSNFCFVI